MTRKEAVLLGVMVSVSSGAPAAPGVAVAWNDDDSQRGVVRGMTPLPPWRFETPPIETGRDITLRFARGTLYALSRAEGTVSAIDTASWTVTRTYGVGPESQPEDIAVGRAGVAYLTRPAATHLLRLDLATGETADVVDLSVFADPDGIPDLGTMAVADDHLFVQVRRLSSGLGPVPPGLIAVVDLTTERLVDVDPWTVGVQAIELSGTAPKKKMQVLPASRQLFVSATGDFHDDGGLESIDLDRLRSRGIVIRELGPRTGPEFGAFVMTRSTSGYVIFSTDWLSSSHLKGFSLSTGVDPPPDLDAVLDYFVPALVHDARTDALFLPVRNDGEFHLADGVHVFDAGTGARLTAEPVPASGPPTDLELLCDDPEVCSPSLNARFVRGDSNADGDVNLGDVLYTLAYLVSGRSAPPCRAGADTNSDGKVDVADPIFLVNYFFGGGPPPPEPFPYCGDHRPAGGVDCRDYDACPPTPPPALVTIVESGPPANRVDMVILGDGYTAPEVGRVYPRHVEALLDLMFHRREDPFPRYRRFFNVHRVDIISSESGADIPSQGIFRDTALDAVFTSGFPTLLYVDNLKASTVLDETLRGDITADLRVVTVNVDGGGGGSGGFFAVYAGADPSGAYIALHEIGHSFSNLADEGIFLPDNEYAGDEHPQANLTISPTAEKWAPWVGYDDPDHPEIGPIGAFEGANYYGRGLYRPSHTSKMSHPGFPFDAVSRQKVIHDIYRHVRPLDAWLDNSAVLVDPEVVHVDVVDPEVVRVEWLVDGEVLPGASGEVLHLGFLAPGRHEVTARAYDDTPWVRQGREHLEQRVTWEILVSERP